MSKAPTPLIEIDCSDVMMKSISHRLWVEIELWNRYANTEGTSAKMLDDKKTEILQLIKLTVLYEYHCDCSVEYQILNATNELLESWGMTTVQVKTELGL
jgi:hypothetical protein